MSHLDGKPSGLPAIPWWARLLGLSRWYQERQLRRAADTGVEFDRMECKHCYGPAWCEL
jgi:hypothetical protein